MKFHLIAIGGSVMHNLAMELQALGHEVTGSDDEIYNPAADRLKKSGLFPSALGWHADKVTPDIDIVILGMHAQLDNPELQRALELKLTIYSFPEYIADHIRDKTKIVITGSHGKTTTTSMIMHVMRKMNIDFDYLVGGLVEGFDRMVRLSSSSKYAVIEGDEYLSSRMDKRPKMLHYNADILITTGVAWDHMNVFPTYESYKEQFRQLFRQLSDNDLLIYCNDDQDLSELVKESEYHNTKPYTTLKNDGTQVYHNGKIYELSIFGSHNFANLNAARLACLQIGIHDDQFFSAIKDFKGAGNRLELICNNPLIYRDFAHAPSKVRATVSAIRERYPKASILAVTELHTYSSLNQEFIPHYRNTLEAADKAIVFYDPEAVRLKRLPELDRSDIRQSFNHKDLIAVNNTIELQSILSMLKKDFDIIVLMSSGKFGGMSISELIEK